jgi:putative peptidoglycan lipid II flippase
MTGMANRAMRMMLGTLASRVLGLFREVLTARYFGATPVLDAYNAAYTLANLSRQLLAEGALSASFVPAFSRVHKRNGEDAAKRLARQVLSILLIVCPVVVLAGMLCSPLLVGIIAPGFSAAQSALASSLTKALFPFLMIVSLGALAMGILNSVGSFFVPAIAPAASNMAFILILLAFGHRMSIWTMVAAVLVGGVCNMALQWGMSCLKGYPPLPARPDFADPDLRRMLALFLPYAAGLSMNQVNPVISRMLGSFLGDGVISVLNDADRIIQLPLGIFVIAISQAVLPMLSRLDPGDRAGFRAFVRDALRFNLFIVLPAAIAVALMARQSVHVLYVRGEFGEWAWTATSGALACYAAGLPGMACNTVLMRALYARSLPKAAMRVTAFTVCANLALGLLLMRRMSYMGLALGTSLAFTGASFFASILIRRDIGAPIGLFEWPWLARLCSSCAAMGAIMLCANKLLPYQPQSAFSYRASWVGGMMALGCAAYAAATTMLKCPEWAWIKGAIGRFGKKTEV